jgi:hypothetical protein
VAAVVLPLKKASQFVFIWLLAPALPPLDGAVLAGAEADGEGAGGADVVGGGGAEDDAPEPAVVPLELLHAVIAATNARPTAGASKIRRAGRRDRMTRLPVS